MAGSEQQWLAVVQVLPQLLQGKTDLDLNVPATPSNTHWKNFVKQKASSKLSCHLPGGS